MKVLVGYESRSGNTERAAKAIAAEAEAQGHDVVCKSLADVRGYDVSLADVLFLGSWVAGFLVIGVGPAHKAITNLEKFGSLEGKKAAVFCTYALNPKSTLDVLRRIIAGRGATVLGEKAFRGHGGETDGAAAFTTQVLEAAAAMKAARDA